MSVYVVDENVLIVANRSAGQADNDCLETCIDFLLHCRVKQSLVLDEGYEILNRYAKHCSWAGQPGFGDQFFLWAQQSAPQLLKVLLTKSSQGEYSDFPEDPQLATFDDDDRLWVAATIAVGPEARLVNAVDSDYSFDAIPLAANGVVVLELCPDILKTR